MGIEVLFDFPIYIRSSVPLKLLKINETTIRDLGKLIYDSSDYKNDEELNESFANNVSLIQKHIKHAPRTTITIKVDNRCFYVSKDKVRSNCKYLEDNEINNVINFVRHL